MYSTTIPLNPPWQAEGGSRSQGAPPSNAVQVGTPDATVAPTVVELGKKKPKKASKVRVREIE